MLLRWPNPSRGTPADFGGISAADGGGGDGDEREEPPVGMILRTQELGTWRLG